MKRLVILDTTREHVLREIRTIPNTLVHNDINFNKQFLTTATADELSTHGFYELKEQTVDLSIYKITGMIEAFNEENLTWERTYTTEKTVTDKEIYNKSLNIFRTKLIQDIQTKFENDILAYVKNYTPTERESWERQLNESKSWLLDNTQSDTPLLDGLSSNRGIDKTILANKIIEKGTIFSMVSGQLLGIQQKYIDIINIVDTIGELETIRDEIFPPMEV